MEEGELCPYHGKRKLELLCYDEACQVSNRLGCVQCFSSVGRHENHSFIQYDEVIQQIATFDVNKVLENIKNKTKEIIEEVNKELDEWYLSVVSKCERLENRYESIHSNYNQVNPDVLFQLFRFKNYQEQTPICLGIDLFKNDLLQTIKSNTHFISKYFGNKYKDKKQECIDSIRLITNQIQSTIHHQDQLLPVQQLSSNANVDTVINTCLFNTLTEQSQYKLREFEQEIIKTATSQFTFDLEELENSLDNSIYAYFTQNQSGRESMSNRNSNSSQSNKNINSNSKKQLTQTQLILQQRQDGLGNGRMFILNSSGYLYEGYAFEGNKHGKGKSVDIVNKQVYIGGYKNDMKHGYGLFITPEFKYQGYFYQDQFQGKGTLTNLGQQIYTGTFANGYQHGQGQLADENGQIILSGTWIKGIHTNATTNSNDNSISKDSEQAEDNTSNSSCSDQQQGQQ